MSTEQQSLDPQLIEQTKQQIRSLVAEIAQLTKADVAPEEFYGQFLTRVVSALAAVGGAVWTTNEEGRLALQYQINLQETRLRENEEALVQHSRLLYKFLGSSEGGLVPPHSGAEGDDQAANPTDFLLVLGLLKTDLETLGLVEIFQRSEAGPATQRGYLRFLSQMCELAGDFLKSHQLRHFSDRQALWTQLEDFTHTIHAGLDPRETAYTIANEGRRLIECDRLSVAIRKGKKCTIEAVSGQDVFDKRSNTIRLLGKLATAVVATGDPVWYTGDTQDMAPQVEDAVQEYVDESHSKTVAVLPLKRPPPVGEEETPEKNEETDPPIAALIVEQIEDSRVPPTMVHRVEVVCRHSSTALANALEHQNLFLMPVWRAIGKSRWIVQGRTLPKTLSIGGAVLVLILALFIWPADFELHSKGTLEPIIKRDVFASIDGRVDEVFVDHGSQVKQGDLLAQLHNTDVEVGMEDVRGRRIATAERIRSVQRSLLWEARLSTEERVRLNGDLLDLKQQAESLDKQWALWQKKQADLRLLSPASGVIVTWKVRELLISRTVQRGQSLMQVADQTGPWQLELQMADNRMGHIARAQAELWEKTRGQLRQMIVESLRAKEPETPQEELEAKAEQQVAAVADGDLHSRLCAVLLEQRRNTLREIVAEEPPESPWTAQLNDVLRADSFDTFCGQLGVVLGDAQDMDRQLRAKLKPLTEPTDDQLKVTYILATDPGTRFEGRVKEIHGRAEVHGEEGNVVLIKVAIDKDELPYLRPGATVNARVYCGRRAIGYVWLHDVVAFIYSRILFHL